MQQTYAYEPENGSLKGATWTFEPEAQPDVSRGNSPPPPATDVQDSPGDDGRKSLGWLTGIFHDQHQAPAARPSHSRSSSQDTPPPPPRDDAVRSRSREDGRAEGPPAPADSASPSRDSPRRFLEAARAAQSRHSLASATHPVDWGNPAAGPSTSRAGSRAASVEGPQATATSSRPGVSRDSEAAPVAGHAVESVRSPEAAASSQRHEQDEHSPVKMYETPQVARDREHDAGAGVGLIEAPPLDHFDDAEVAAEREAAPWSPAGGSASSRDHPVYHGTPDTMREEETPDARQQLTADLSPSPPPKRGRCGAAAARCWQSCGPGCSNFFLECFGRRELRRSSTGSPRKSRRHLVENGDCWTDCFFFIADVFVDVYHYLKEIDGSSYVKTASQRYAMKGPARCPCFCCFIYLVMIIAAVIVGMVLMPIEVETDFDSFQKTDVEASLYRDTFLYALGKRMEDERRLQAAPQVAEQFEDWRWFESTSQDEPRGLLARRTGASGSDTEGRSLSAGAILYKHFDLEIVYEAPDDGDLLKPDILQSIAKFERQMRSNPMWSKLCEDTDPLEHQFCDLGISFVNYALPSLSGAVTPSIVPDQLSFDGRGEDVIPSATIAQVLETPERDFKTGVAPVVLTKDIDLANGLPASMSLIRSVFRWKFECCKSWDPVSLQREVVGQFKDRWFEFITEEFLPKVEELAPQILGEGEDGIRVYYNGFGILNFEVLNTLLSDMKLAAGAMCFVLLYIWFHTKSLMLSFMSIVVIILSIPLSYVCFSALTGQRVMNLASFLSVFLVVGLGSDVVFVYSDFWKDSTSKVPLHPDDPLAITREATASRMAWTYYNAGKASLATTATTAISFFANLASVLKPLREFGFFMGLNVMLVWILLSLVFVPLCHINERWWNRKGTGTGRCSAIWASCSEYIAEPKECCQEFWYNFRILCLPDLHWLVDREAWTLRLHRWRHWVLIGTVLGTLGAMVWAAAKIEVDTGVPNIFPTDHNQNRGQQVIQSQFRSVEEAFDPLALPPPNQSTVCREYNFGSSVDDCSLFWCEVPAGAQLVEENQCQCSRIYKPAATCGAAGTAYVEQRFFATSALSLDQVRGAVETLASKDQQTHKLTFSGVTSSTILNPLVLQEWETGGVTIAPVLQVNSRMTRTDASFSCGFQDICFCGIHSCARQEGWQDVGEVSLAERRLAAAYPMARQLQTWTVPSSARAEVEVVFGLKVTLTQPLLGPVDKNNLWAFDEQHQVSQPWAQRNMYSLCQNLPENLRVTDRRCWIEDWRRYLVEERNMRFPATTYTFDENIIHFSQTQLTGLGISQDYLWFRDDAVKASFMSFTIDVNDYAATEVAIANMAKWDQYLIEYNEGASKYANKAFHCASLWVRAEAQSALIMSTVVTIALVILLAMMGMLAFTKDWCLSFMVVVATCMVVMLLIFFMVVVAGWLIGPIEVIALIVFIGYAVTYSLHIAHRYGCAEALTGPPPPDQEGKVAIRLQRTHYAMASIGPAAAGSAATTAGAALFLIFCTLTIFKKLGGVVMCVTVMSIVMALGPLCAALFSFGPLHPGRQLIPRCWPSVDGSRRKLIAIWKGGPTDLAARVRRSVSREGLVIGGFSKDAGHGSRHDPEAGLKALDEAIDSPGRDFMHEPEKQYGAKTASFGNPDEPDNAQTAEEASRAGTNSFAATSLVTKPLKWFASERAPVTRDPVRLTMKLRKLDYNLLHADGPLLEAFTEKLKQAVAREAANSVSATHVDVRLSPGSVVAEATITPPEGCSSEAVLSKLRSSFTISDSVERQIRNVKGIQAASTGLITVCDITISKAPPVLVADAPVEASPRKETTRAAAPVQESMRNPRQEPLKHRSLSGQRRSADAAAPQEFTSISGPRVRELAPRGEVTGREEVGQGRPPLPARAAPTSWELPAPAQQSSEPPVYRSVASSAAAPAPAPAAVVFHSTSSGSAGPSRPTSTTAKHAPPVLLTGPPTTTVGAPQLGPRAGAPPPRSPPGRSRPGPSIRPLDTMDAGTAELHLSAYSAPPSKSGRAFAPAVGAVGTPASAVASDLGKGRGRDRRKKLSEMDFDIGDETPIDKIWSREVESTGKVHIVDNRTISRERR